MNKEDMDSFVLFVGTKKSASRMAKEMQDLVSLLSDILMNIWYYQMPYGKKNAKFVKRLVLLPNILKNICYLMPYGKRNLVTD